MPVAQVNVPRGRRAGGIAVSVFQLDRNGFVMKPLDPRLCMIPLSQMSAELPAVTGLNVYQLQPGHRVESPQAQAALQLDRRVRPFADGGAGGFAARGCFVAGRGRGDDGAGREITFALENLEQQLARWRKIYDLGQQHEQGDCLAGSGGVQQRARALDDGQHRCPRRRPIKSNPAKNRRKNV